MARPNNSAAIAAHMAGLREAKAAFQRLPEVTRDRLNGATVTSVQEIARLARINLERSPSIQTRALYDHVGWSMNWKAGRGSAGIKRATTTLLVGGRKVRVKGIIRAGAGGGAAGGTKDQPSRRAHFIEFGAAHHSAEPFMLPATETERPHYLDRCVRAGKDIERDLTVGTGGAL